MSESKGRMHDGRYGSALAIRISPGAATNEISEIDGEGTIWVRLAVPASEEKINRALVEFLSDVLQVPRSKVDIIAGSGREKLVSVLDLDADTVQARLYSRLS